MLNIEWGQIDPKHNRRVNTTFFICAAAPEAPEAPEAWPPCVRVTVVRSPALQIGSLFILTADAAATIGR